jgi:PAS domain-containing protein
LSDRDLNFSFEDSEPMGRIAPRTSPLRLKTKKTGDPRNNIRSHEMNDGPSDPSTPTGGETRGTDLGNSGALWKLLWDFDPNGLLVLDDAMRIILVNPAMCQMLKTKRERLLGQPAVDYLNDISDFERAYALQQEVVGQEASYPRFDLHARKVIFPVPNEKVVAGIFVDLTHEWKQQNELEALRTRTAQEVRNVVDKQMRVAQEIAGLLGETTAETKVSLLRLLDLLHPDHE